MKNSAVSQSSLLDELCPPPFWAVRHVVETAATPQQVFGALPLVTLGAIFEEARRSGHRMSVPRRMVDTDRPAYTYFLEHGFLVLASEPLREVVAGRAASWREGAPKNRTEWQACGAAAVKIAAGVHSAGGSGLNSVTLEVRVRGLGGLLTPILIVLQRFVNTRLAMGLDVLCAEASVTAV